MSDKAKVDRSHYIASFREYVVELSSNINLIYLGVEENAQLKMKAKDSKRKKMERDLRAKAIRLGLSQAEVKRIAISCGLETNLAACIAIEFTKKSLTLHRMAG